MKVDGYFVQSTINLKWKTTNIYQQSKISVIRVRSHCTEIIGRGWETFLAEREPAKAHVLKYISMRANQYF